MRKVALLTPPWAHATHASNSARATTPNREYLTLLTSGAASGGIGTEASGRVADSRPTARLRGLFEALCGIGPTMPNGPTTQRRRRRGANAERNRTRHVSARAGRRLLKDQQSVTAPSPG